MRGDQPSSSAQAVAVVRAHLTGLGIIDDPQARSLLTPGWAAVGWLLRGPLRPAGRTPTISFLAARTLFFDDQVLAALDIGIGQVVVVGAGYDTRAWRLARPGVAFYEVDHPATQADKRRRAPDGGPTYVPVDLTGTSLPDALARHGLDVTRPTVFVVEGLTMYFDEATVRRLLSDLATLGAPGSRLAVNVTARGGGSVAPLSRLAAKAVRATFRRRGEAITTWVRPDGLEAFVTGCGWQAIELTAAPELAATRLTRTGLPTSGLSPGALVVTARR